MIEVVYFKEVNRGKLVGVMTSEEVSKKYGIKKSEISSYREKPYQGKYRFIRTRDPLLVEWDKVRIKLLKA